MKAIVMMLMAMMIGMIGCAHSPKAARPVGNVPVYWYHLLISDSISVDLFGAALGELERIPLAADHPRESWPRMNIPGRWIGLLWNGQISVEEFRWLVQADSSLQSLDSLYQMGLSQIERDERLRRWGLLCE